MVQGGVGRACDATQRYYTLTPIAPDSLIPRSLVYSFPFPPPSRLTFPVGYSHCLSYLPLSLFLSAARSFGDAAALSGQTADAIFSGSWQSFVGRAGGSAIATKKRAPRGRSLRPSNWRRCPSTVARMIVLSFASVPFLPLSVLISLHARSLSLPRIISLSLPRIVSFSLRPSYVFFFSLSLFSHFPSLSSLLYPLFRLHWTSSIGRRSVDATFEAMVHRELRMCD